MTFKFDNSYAHLPERFFAHQNPVPVRAPRLVRVNARLAALLGVEPAITTDHPSAEVAARLAAIFAGNTVPEGAEPIAAVYAGHQFGQWVPRLGDGRAVLLGEVIGRDGIRRDIQLKGAGRTPFSRGGDGRAALGPVLREYIVSEAMAALGIPSTRALAAVLTGEEVLREVPLPGAILTRVARSHVRIGTFQYFAANGDTEAVRVLVDYVIRHLYPDAAHAAAPVRAMLDHVIAAQAKLVAQWMSVGFIHGVMNTDNMSIAGETIDFGPCAFMDGFNPAAVFSAIDEMGRYAWGYQPTITHWNLARFCQTLLPLLSENGRDAQESAQEALDAFPVLFETAWLGIMRAKLGFAEVLTSAGIESETGAADRSLVKDLLKIMTNHGRDDSGADFTLTFRWLSELAINVGDEEAQAAETRFMGLFAEQEPVTSWLARWRQRLSQAEGPMPGGDNMRQERMRAINPTIIPRNHLIQEAISAALEEDFAPFDALVDALANPFVSQSANAYFMAPPRPEQVVTQTFCGT
ncbi:protein adenylyltransferase SelO [Pseudochelatococcus sp. G4_1912]|uniref:protein adenylyltransferase SelO n=1 Tax=Pseudochelatococcus sp. G4_1912 TaxID=3114288 RepID=UPI0039C6909F